MQSRIHPFPRWTKRRNPREGRSGGRGRELDQDWQGRRGLGRRIGQLDPGRDQDGLGNSCPAVSGVFPIRMSIGTHVVAIKTHPSAHPSQHAGKLAQLTWLETPSIAFSTPDSVTVDGARSCDPPTIGVAGTFPSPCVSSETSKALSVSSMLALSTAAETRVTRLRGKMQSLSSPINDSYANQRTYLR